MKKKDADSEEKSNMEKKHIGLKGRQTETLVQLNFTEYS